MSADHRSGRSGAASPPGRKLSLTAPLTANSAAGSDPAIDPGSPCISICRMDRHSGLCEGCLRTLDEIASWSLMSVAEKRAVWAQLETRASGAGSQPA